MPAASSPASTILPRFWSGPARSTAGGVAELVDMRILERDPPHAPDIDPVIVLQMAAQPYAGRLRKGAHPDPAAGQVRRRDSALLCIVEHAMVLEPPHHHRRQQHQGLAIGPRLQIRDDRHLADVEGPLPHHGAEHLVDRLDLGEVEGDRLRGDLLVLQRSGVRIVAQRHAQSRHLLDAHRRLLPPVTSAKACKPRPATIGL